MKRFFACLAMLTLLSAARAEKLNTVLLHQGEKVYVHFETGKKIKLQSVSKQADDKAQVVISLTPDADGKMVTLTVENKFSLDLVYRAEIRSNTLHREMPLRVAPVVAGKLGIEQMPKLVDEVSLFDFRLQK